MEPIIEKVSETEVKITREHEKTVSLVDLRADLEAARRSLAEFEAWVLEERASRQELVDKKASYVNKAEELGVVDTPAVAPAEAVPEEEAPEDLAS